MSKSPLPCLFQDVILAVHNLKRAKFRKIVKVVQRNNPDCENVENDVRKALRYARDLNIILKETEYVYSFNTYNTKGSSKKTDNNYCAACYNIITNKRKREQDSDESEPKKKAAKVKTKTSDKNEVAGTCNPDCNKDEKAAKDSAKEVAKSKKS